MASAVKPAFESNENLLESFVRLTVPLILHVLEGAIKRNAEQRPENRGHPEILWRMWQKLGISLSTPEEREETDPNLMENIVTRNTVVTRQLNC
jgi:hypothetical protein